MTDLDEQAALREHERRVLLARMKVVLKIAGGIFAALAVWGAIALIMLTLGCCGG